MLQGSGGGPIEHNTTAFLVRSVASGWKRGSVVAVDAGVHLGAISRILESSQPKHLGSEVSLPHTLQEGPFAGLEIQSSSPVTNAAHVTQSLIDTFLITHPHLDHISAFVVNTAGLTRPKRLAGLPSTIAAFKTHIFNNVIWPNLSDENNGAGLVTYMRLVEGGSPAMGEGEEKGYMEVSDGLSVKIWSVSHGHCIEKHSHRGSQGSQGGRQSSVEHPPASPMTRSLSHPQVPVVGSTPSLTPSRFPPHINPQIQSFSPGGTRESVCVYDSSAYFIRDAESGKEVLIFGDVEPDSISLSPRNLAIWQEAAPKIASGVLRGIFIECSYDNSQSLDRLFGHLKPCYVIEELKVLAREVDSARDSTIRESKKRKRGESHSAGSNNREESLTVQTQKKIREEPVSPKTLKPPSGPPRESLEQVTERSSKKQVVVTPTVEVPPDDDDGNMGGDRSTPASLESTPTAFALKGLKVVIIHIKDRLSDGYNVGEKILQELKEEDEIEKLGCEFMISHPGASIYL